MKLFSHPSSDRIRNFIRSEQLLPFSYAETGGTRRDDPVRGFDNDFNFIELGFGDTTWQAAKTAIRQWKMFPGDWARITPDDSQIREGEIVAMTARVLGFWWLNSCRIVYVIDNERQFGFAYGTLPGHVECGEELFMVEKTDSGTVRYVIKAFSKPRFWMTRLGYPMVRQYQKKFVRDSKQSMLSFVQKQTT